MFDVFEVADLLVSHATETHGEQVDIIGYYGSHAQGTATAGSDLDIFYIPREGTYPPIARTFLVDGVLFDFWAIGWDTMKGFATGHVRGWSFAPAIVHHARVLYARSEEQALRFAALKQQVLDLQTPEARPQMIRRALETFPRVALHLGNLRLAASDTSLADVRHAGWKVILSVCECLALANQMFFHRGLRSIPNQLSKLQKRPADLELLVITIATSSDLSEVVAACEQLAQDTRKVLRGLQNQFPSTATVRDVFHQAYPEIRDMIGKIESACRRGEEVAASGAAWFLQYDLSMTLEETRRAAAHDEFNLYDEFSTVYREVGLPDLMQVPSADMDELAAQAGSLDSRLRQWLQKESVSLNEFRDLEELRQWLRS
jgi:hypothetical protein